jgi:excisionase family DNA binding protein
MTDEPTVEPAVYRVAELAQLLDMGRRQTYEAIKRKEIPCHKLGKQLRCSKVAIHAWLDRAEPNGTTEQEGISRTQDWTQE